MCHRHPLRSSYTAKNVRAAHRCVCLQVLADLVQALYPTLLQQPVLQPQLVGVQATTPYFLRNVARGQNALLLSASTCPLNQCR